MPHSDLELALEPLPIETVTTEAENGDRIDHLQLDESNKHDKVLRVFRCLIADLCEQFKGGHPG